MAATTISRANIGTNDDGSGTTGTVVNVAYIGLIYDNIDALFSSTTGITLNQAGGDSAILTLESSDVAHGMTTYAATAAYGRMVKNVAASGGLDILGLTSSVVALQLNGYGTTDDTAKTTNGLAPVVLYGAKKSGTGVAAGGANANIVVIQSAGTTRFIFDVEGDMHYDGAAPANYDTWDDVALTRALDQTFRGTGLIETEWDKFVQYNRADLERAGIISEGGFVNLTKHTRLLNGALWQQHCRMKVLEAQNAQLTGRLLALEGR